MYAFHLKNWMKWWGQKDSIKVVNYEHLRSNLENIFDYLKLKYTNTTKMITKNENNYTNKVKRPECEVVKTLTHIYSPYNENYTKCFQRSSCFRIVHVT